MSLPVISGQTLIDMFYARVGGYGAAFTVNEILDFLNEAKDELWGVLRTLDEDYFVAGSQASTSTDDDYFAALTTSSREVNLPNNCREVRSIEVTTAGYEDWVFEWRNLSDPEFQAERRAATSAGAGCGRQLTDTFFYTILGRRTLMLATYPDAAVTAKIWYVKALDDFDVDDEITDILHPFSKKLVSFAAERGILSLQDEQLSEEWRKRWKEDVQAIALVAAPRSSTNAEFVTDWEGDT